MTKDIDTKPKYESKDLDKIIMEAFVKTEIEMLKGHPSDWQVVFTDTEGNKSSRIYLDEFLNFMRNEVKSND